MSIRVESGMEFIDCHCHIAENYFYKKMEFFVNEWEKLGIRRIGAMATNLKSTKRNLELASMYPNLFVASIGRHPWGAHKFNAEERESFEKIVSDSRVEIIGEIGLDHYFIKEKEKYPQQKIVLEFFLKLAQKHSKPVMLHMTGAEKEILDILTTFQLEKNICCHWYSGPTDVLRELHDLGCYFSVNPAFLRSKNHRNVLKIVAKEKLLTESDGTVKFQDEPGSPSLMPYLCEKIAEELKITTKDVSNQIVSNFQAYLK
ncbi:MAG: TatD family hydrolase [Candidatus Heimdallarchaeota archaeon]